MTDVQSTSTPERTRIPPAIRRVGRPSNASKRQPMGLSRKVKAAIDLMHTEGLTRKQAAERAGLSDNSLYMALRNPVVRRYHTECSDVLRTSEGPRSIHKIAELRDKAESERVQLDAAKYLDGGDKGSGVTVNVGLGVNVAPGYMIDVSEHAQASTQLLKQARSTRNALEISQSVPIDDDGTR